ncbi:hypothetical protein [Marinobacterium weihaiense]|uniref:Uncharacterized protein n=1 Tax=Marinobacterium weihaiense TaxID=2851016 RepID=A0ABS6MA97_9GAMM|nr:hypothetical protein [Marinobacterium weihaiense]MBV0932824.1 hypothetical protein [Marinobacterium weihaiense]
MKQVVAGLMLALATAPVWADKPAWAGKPAAPDAVFQGQEPGGQGRERSDAHENRLLPLSHRERRQLRDWVLQDHYGYRPQPGQGGVLPPGLRKKLARGGELPPGWQDKLRRGERFDDDYYRYGERLSRHYLERLGYDAEAAELILLGGRVVRVAEGRGTILDVVELTDKALELMGN